MAQWKDTRPWCAALLAVLMLFGVAGLLAQGEIYAPPNWPTGTTRPEEVGFFVYSGSPNRQIPLKEPGFLARRIDEALAAPPKDDCMPCVVGTVLHRYRDLHHYIEAQRRRREREEREWANRPTFHF